MRNKILAILMSVCMLVLLASCGNASKETSSKNVKKQSTTQTTKETTKHTKNDKTEKRKRTDMEIRNYRNYFTAVDEKNIYCIDNYGLYKISKSDNKVKRLAKFNVKNNEYGCFLTLHNDYIYFMTNKNLFRIKKDGSKKFMFSNVVEKGEYVGLIKCIDNKLYKICKNGCCYDIENDPDELECIETNIKFLPDLDNINFYKNPPYEIYADLYYSNTQSKQKQLVSTGVKEYSRYYDIVTYSKITPKKSIYIYNLNKNKSKLLYETEDEFVSLIYCDHEWAYISTDDSNQHCDQYKRINCSTGEVQNLDKVTAFYKDKTQPAMNFEINSDFLFIKESGHIKYIKSDGTGKWQDIN